jgi:endonuclease-3
MSVTLTPADRLNAIEPILDEVYGPRQLNPDRDPVSTLVSTILSQNTSDTNTARSFRSLRNRFPTWNDVVGANPEDVIDAIRSGGLANRKGPRIQAALEEIEDRYGTFTLDNLATMPIDAARAELVSIDGVGPKTAACVLLFSMGLPAMPVDTHVHRVATRVGLIEPGATANAAHAKLESLIGDNADRVYRLHVEIIAHGRAVCQARRPRCELCPLRSHCEYATSREN